MRTRTLPDALRAAGIECIECPPGAWPFDLDTVEVRPFAIPPDDSHLAWWHRVRQHREPWLPPPRTGHVGDRLFLNLTFTEALLTPLDTEMLRVDYQERYERDGRRAANEWLRVLVWGPSR